MGVGVCGGLGRIAEESTVQLVGIKAALEAERERSSRAEP